MAENNSLCYQSRKDCLLGSITDFSLIKAPKGGVQVWLSKPWADDKTLIEFGMRTIPRQTSNHVTTCGKKGNRMDKFIISMLRPY